MNCDKSNGLSTLDFDIQVGDEVVSCYGEKGVIREVRRKRYDNYYFYLKIDWEDGRADILFHNYTKRDFCLLGRNVFSNYRIDEVNSRINKVKAELKKLQADKKNLFTIRIKNMLLLKLKNLSKKR